MSIYSELLGSGAWTDLGVNHELYTVPVSQGPAVVRSFTAFTNATGGIILTVTPPGGTLVYLADVDNTAGTQGLSSTVQLYQPLPPGTVIAAQQWAADVFWSVILGGYQFATP